MKQKLPTLYPKSSRDNAGGGLALEIPDTLINYTNISKRGNRLKSASIAIRDDKSKMIGAFCLNFDISGFEHIQKFLHLLTESESSI
jgi:predicted transcriptional regulator YheO